MRTSCDDIVLHSGMHILPVRWAMLYSFILQSVWRHVHSLFPKRVPHTVRSSASSFNFGYPLVSLRSSNSCLHLFLPHLPITSILPSIFPPITCFRRHFLHKTWPILLAFLPFIVCRIFLFSLTLCNISSFFTRSAQLSFSVILQHHILKLSRYF